MKEERLRIDWEEVYARLERARRALEASGEPEPEEAQRILRERARALARPRAEVPAPSETLDLLVFSLGAERYGIETAHVLDVVRFRGLTPLPCTPSFVLGLMSHRGSVLPVLDLRRLFERPAPQATEGSRVVAVAVGGMTFGILADAVAGSVRVAVEELAPPPAALLSGGRAFARGVTAEMVAVLDLEALVRDPRIVVSEEVG